MKYVSVFVSNVKNKSEVSRSSKSKIYCLNNHRTESLFAMDAVQCMVHVQARQPTLRFYFNMYTMLRLLCLLYIYIYMQGPSGCAYGMFVLFSNFSFILFSLGIGTYSGCFSRPFLRIEGLWWSIVEY